VPLYRMQVANFATGALAIDHSVNVLYFNVSANPFDTAEVDALADDVMDAYDGLASLVSRNYLVKTYKMSDVEPRVPVSTRSRTQVQAPFEAGPREVALCLSYYAGLNRPRTRGRIYLGPFASGKMKLRPEADLIGDLIQFGQDLSAVGGLNVDWSVYSPTTGLNNAITNLWVDNEWDTQRRRGLRPTSRSVASING
jgi:hypothetical protein